MANSDFHPNESGVAPPISAPGVDPVVDPGAEQNRPQAHDRKVGEGSVTAVKGDKVDTGGKPVGSGSYLNEVWKNKPETPDGSGGGGGGSKNTGPNGQQNLDMLNQGYDLARQQYNLGLDNAMNQQALDLNRALSDAQRMYQTQRNQVAADERNALDNAALYAEARGDKGGIGQAQYASIQNAAAQNRLAVSQAQTQLATDTYRQIADLRAQGEFQRADKMLELAQSHLAELRQIQQYAQQYNLSKEQLDQALADWKAAYQNATAQYTNSMNAADAALTGAYISGSSLAQGAQSTSKALADLAIGLLQQGVSMSQLSPAQRSALAETYGMTYSA